MHNAVLGVEFSDVQESQQGLTGNSSLLYDAMGDEYFFQDDRLIGASIDLLFRDGQNYYQTNTDFTGVDKEFQFDDETGTVTFPPSFPPLNTHEKVNLTYISADGSAVITEPVTLQQAKDWLRVTHDDEDSIILSLIIAARQYCEGLVGLSFVQRTVTAYLKNELGNIRLPYGPVWNITNVYDVEGNVIDTENYRFLGNTTKQLQCPQCSFVKVVYTAGYLVLPPQFVIALKTQIAWMYTHRGDDTETSIAPETKAILKPYRV
jgi:uncharacterized phiE125 gp8 family phage protein